MKQIIQSKLYSWNAFHKEHEITKVEFEIQTEYSI